MNELPEWCAPLCSWGQTPLAESCAQTYLQFHLSREGLHGKESDFVHTAADNRLNAFESDKLIKVDQKLVLGPDLCAPVSYDRWRTDSEARLTHAAPSDAAPIINTTHRIRAFVSK